MSVLTYTSYDDVRAALGVTRKDLADETLELTYYSDALDEELVEVSPNLANHFTNALQALAPTEAQVRLLRTTRQFATLAVARVAVTAIEMFAPQQVSDGKASMQRFSDPVAALTKRIDTRYATAKTKVSSAVTAVGSQGSGTTRRPYSSVVSPASDPVTG